MRILKRLYVIAESIQAVFKGPTDINETDYSSSMTRAHAWRMTAKKKASSRTANIIGTANIIVGEAVVQKCETHLPTL